MLGRKYLQMAATDERRCLLSSNSASAASLSCDIGHTVYLQGVCGRKRLSQVIDSVCFVLFLCTDNGVCEHENKISECRGEERRLQREERV